MRMSSVKDIGMIALLLAGGYFLWTQRNAISQRVSSLVAGVI